MGIAGSLRRASSNRRLLAAAAHALPPGTRLRNWDELAAVPPFDEDAEDGLVPAAVASLRAAVAAADGLLLVTPEYNGSIPGQLKNALDWASRPYGDSVLTGLPVAVTGTSPGPGGAAGAQTDLRRVLARSGATVVGEVLAVPEGFRVFDEHDRMLDPTLRTALTALVTDLHAAARGVAAMAGRSGAR